MISMKFTAILSRDVAYYLLNAPSIDSKVSTKALKKRRRGKYYHFALRCVDPLVLYDTLYLDHSVPTPFSKEPSPYWWFYDSIEEYMLNKSHPPIYTYFSEDQQEFYKALYDSGVIRQIPLSLETFGQLFEETICDISYLIERGELKNIWNEMKGLAPDLDKRFWLSNPCYLEESSIFWRETQLLAFSRYQQSSGLQRDLWSLMHRSEDSALVPWIFSSLLCGKLQAVLGIPGVYSTFSFPCCSYLTSGQAMVERERAIRGVFKDILDYYKRIFALRVRIPIPSFSMWCTGTGQESETFSNLEILKRAMQIRNNKHIKSFRDKFWEIVTEILSTCSDGQSQIEVQSKVDEVLSKSLSDLISSLSIPWKSKVKSAVLTAVIGSPVSFLALNPVIGATATATSNVGIELFKQLLSDRRMKSDYGWLFFLHEEVSGYS